MIILFDYYVELTHEDITHENIFTQFQIISKTNNCEKNKFFLKFN